ncbi:zinc-binding alcohol dehydrogenase family protein [Bombilactobacillus folatiphilus]|uniref:Zinc-binding alcohol dehydrogenase family protein n=1 Tax=Bombilactobacillus folatiphilus TaxID=2923362 RepID=A0ABY4PBC9_9LACO|nr:zinc-binding alcohol dehydrogenase family protein [Bombilactobacillus folatiphilus]UQS82572.1 zinc-binding alcohol dehydrogenase family protein [Bombilactobacillus folatiphilus]
MQAAIITAPNTLPVIDEFPNPKVQNTQEQIVTVKASALSNFSKMKSLGKHYTKQDYFPRVAGIDGVGTLADGQLVYFFKTIAPYGSLAAQTLVKQSDLIELPANLAPILAATLANPAMSSYAALTYRAHLQQNEVVLINGATGLAGQLAVKIAYALGARKVVVTGRSPIKLAQIKADAFVASENYDLKTSTGRSGYVQALGSLTSDVSVVLDYLWGPTTTMILQALQQFTRVQQQIRYVEIGSIVQSELVLPAQLLRSQNLSLLGSGIGSVTASDMKKAIAQSFELAVKYNWQLPLQKYSLQQVPKAWQAAGVPRAVITFD